MKFLFILFFCTTALYSYLLDNKLPKETIQLVESFDCFSKDDKTMIYSYVLALKYRMNHIDDRDALVKGDLDYWRLWHIVSDIGQECKLHYRFSKIVNETMLHSDKERKIYKTLQRVEGSINTDGSSGSSAKTSQYDEKLRQKILTNPPQYTILEKKSTMQNYNLKSLKEYKPKSIPKNIVEQIDKKKITPHQKDILFRYAYLKEEMIRGYDKPKKRHKYYQEMLYLSECQKMDGYYLRVDFYPNFKHKLSRRAVATSNSYYPLKTEFLPKEVELYCENNITKMKLGTFEPKADKEIKNKPKKVVAKLENLKIFLKQYENNTTKKKYTDEYYNLIKKLLETPSRGTPNKESLRLLRLKNCIIGKDSIKDFELIMARVKDFRLEGLKETFYTNIFNSQKWWQTTIKMKLKSEGESQEIKNFFLCSKLNSFSKTIKPTKKHNTTSKRVQDIEIEQKIENAGWQKRELLKYLCGTFDGKSAASLDNKQAIEIGIIPKKFISEDGKIVPKIGSNLTIKGVATGGFSITYDGLKRGRECQGMLEFLNMDENIHFNNKRYKGIDYVVVNNTQIMIDNFSKLYAKKLCNQEESNKISYVMINRVSEGSFDIKKYKSLYKNSKRKHIPYRIKRKPKSLFIGNNGLYLMTQHKTKIFDSSNNSIKDELPEVFDYSYNTVMSNDGIYIATKSNIGNIELYNQNSKKSKNLGKMNGTPKLFFMNNTILAIFANKKIVFININTAKIIGEIQPRFIEPNKKYFTPSLESISITSDSNDIYILSDKGEIEHWSIKKSSDRLDIKYIDNINTNKVLISSFVINPNNEKQLLLSTNKSTIEIRNRKTYQLLKTLKTDRRVIESDIQISKDSKYLLAYSSSYVYIWNLETGVLIDVIGSNKNEIYGAMFMPNRTKEILIIGKSKEVWSIDEMNFQIHTQPQ